MTTGQCGPITLGLTHNVPSVFFLSTNCPNIIGSKDYGDFTYLLSGNQISFLFRINETTNDRSLEFPAFLTFDPKEGSIIDISYDTSNQSQMRIYWSEGNADVEVEYVSPGYGFSYFMIFELGFDIVSITITFIRVVKIQHSSEPINNTNNINIKNNTINSINNVPNILITADFSQIIYDVSEVRYLVTYNQLYTCGFGCYNGFTQHLSPTQTLFYLVPQNIGNAIIGDDSLTLIQKVLNTPFLSNIDPLTGYALLKMILGRVLFGKFDAKWMYRKYYNELITAVLDSPYEVFYTDYLGPNKSYEQYFKYKRDSSLYD